MTDAAPLTEDTDGAAMRLRTPGRFRIVNRIGIVTLLIAAIGAIWWTNLWLTDRFSENTRVRSELRSALYTGNLLSELQRTSVVPLLLARDPALIGALSTKDYATVSARLIAAQKDIGAASIRLLDNSGRTVGATDRKLLGANYVLSPFYVEALRTNDTVFTVSPATRAASTSPIPAPWSATGARWG